ncbi:oxygenase MpaB family protein [Plantactinospora siamensis]|uniref:Oxygenase MpaB family protein n=1 Tax=Plantactinospora siamensis TaxID=555372 RepID=A0ABV6P4H1_9ACTN
MFAYPGRLDRVRQARRLDPARDYETIYRNMALWDFPADLRMGLLLAFWRTFTIPRLAGILLATGTMTGHTRRRADDTGILMYELVLHGLDDPRGRRATRRLNRIHRGLPVGNEDHLYVLATLIVIPTRWLDRYGWRPVCCHERAATHAFYRELGRRLNIRDIPDSYADTERRLRAYERRNLRYSPAGAELMAATKQLLADLPAWLTPAAARVADALLDPQLRSATGVGAPPRTVGAAVSAALTVRQRLGRLLPPRRRPWLADGIVTATHPDGYDLDRVGRAYLPAD